MDWTSFWIGLAATAPTLVVSLVVLYFTHRSNKAAESYRTALAERLSILESELQTRAGMFSAWHQKRLDALVEIYQAVRLYLDFLRKALYIPGSRVSLDPMWDFRRTLDTNLVYLDSSLQFEVQRISGELLLFWNWARGQSRGEGVSDDTVQKRLDFEMPGYLERLRKIINSYADPRASESGIQAN